MTFEAFGGVARELATFTKATRTLSHNRCTGATVGIEKKAEFTLKGEIDFRLTDGNFPIGLPRSISKKEKPRVCEFVRVRSDDIKAVVLRFLRSNAAAHACHPPSPRCNGFRKGNYDEEANGAWGG